MAGYDVVPCSIYNSPPVVLDINQVPPLQEHRQPKVVEDTAPLKEEDVVAAAAFKKRSCISAANPRKEIPEHPGRHKKTVAFGRTVNVSQTVESTSRAAKKLAEQRPAMENKEDLVKIIHEELAATRKEIQEENARKQEELNEQNLKAMQEMMANFFKQVAQPVQSAQPVAAAVVAKPTRKPENYEEPRSRGAPKISTARQILQKEGRIAPEVIPLLERRLQTDPMFRQKVDDVLAEAEYEFDRNNAYSPPPHTFSDYPTAQPSPMYTGGANPSRMMRETFTVERSIHYDGGAPHSMDSRQWNSSHKAPGRAGGGGGGYEPDPVLQSTYQPGNSVSYYPSARHCYVEHIEEEDEVEDDAPVENHRQHFENRRGPRRGTKEEREKELRERYGRH